MVNRDELASFLTVFFGSALFHVVLRIAWGAAAPRVVGKSRWDALSESKRYSLRFAPNMALNGIVAPLLVMPALTRTPPLLSNGTYATVVLPRHPNSDLACATAIGYMAFDLGAMLIGYKASIKSNGAAMFHLYVWHHLLSILFWPVAILNNAFVFFVDWFVASEMSSPWLAARGAMLTLGTINTPLGILVQLAFVATFFWGRIWVMPDLIRSLRLADWSAVPAWQANLAACTVPIPFMLNVYWGLMIARSVAKVAFGGKSGKARAGAKKKSA